MKKSRTLKENIEAQMLVYEKLRAEAKRLNAQQVKEKHQALVRIQENVEEKIEQLKSDYFELLNEQASDPQRAAIS